MNIAGKEIRIFGDTSKAAPIVYLHTFRQEGEKVWKQCGKISTRRFILVEIGGVDWNKDMSPWASEKLFAEDTACTGGGEEWLQVLTSQIIPAVEKDFTVTRRCIAGYSLAGLFALWAAYRTDVFDGVISGSGSFWYPGFIEFADSHVLMGQLSSIYFSLGDRESHVGNQILQCVEDNTRWLFGHYQALGINTTFELNTGNHYMQTELRMAKGIRWMLRQ
jgi:predicted alpha/beta superfamily hydrolase